MGNYNCIASKEAPNSNTPVVATTKSGAAVAKDSNLKSGQNTLSRYLQQNHDAIFASNKKWIEARLAGDPQFFEKLSAGQHPDYLYIGCSDSRVPANEIMGLDAGEVFIHRNIANLVPNTDLNVMSVVEYAVVHLHIKHIIVCGHYNCGGIQAALTPSDMGLLNPWLRNIRDVYRIHEKELDKIKDEDQKYRRLVELNVLEQGRNVIKTATVQRSYYEHGYPIVHGWVFDLKDGVLKDLRLDFLATLAGIKKIYNLEGEINTEKGTPYSAMSP